MTLALEPPEKFSLLVIDDEPALLALMQQVFRDLPLDVLTASEPAAALALLKERQPRLVFLDLRLRKTSGLELLEQILKLDPRTEVILLSGDYSPSEAMEAVRRGAADCLAKPVSVAMLRSRVMKAIQAAQDKKQTRELDAGLRSSFQFQGMVGRSPRMLDLFNTMERIAPYFRSVLVSGPPGSGKGLVARTLHNLSPSRNGPFVVCHCAALPQALVDSEMFGCEKVFAGAAKSGPGLFEEADQGIAFLDEIGHMPMGTQAKLLRAMQTQELQREGSSDVKRWNVRVIAASTRDLQSEVAERRFREDLYYRLSAVHLQLPSLADRKEDLPLLQQHFLEKFSKEYRKPISGISRRAQDLLSHHSWPGNVAELENAIATACMACEGPILDTAHFPASLGKSGERFSVKNEFDIPK
jgi:DNA-binding NtrC family response regulator